jgi:NAD(P)H-hydrate epimerase
LEPAASHAGPWSVIDIGIPDEAVSAEGSDLEWLDEATAVGLMPARPAEAHKGTMGHLLVVAGSRGKSGAAVLTARAALRSGVGLVTVAAPRSIQPVVATAQPEVMTEPIDETSTGAAAASAATRVLDLLGSRDALAIGTGLGTEAPTREMVLTVLSRRRCPAVVDADALNVLATGGPDALRAALPKHAPWVLTPHPGEAARLLESSTAAIQADRLGSARRLADLTGAMVVLKGHRTVIASPGGGASINSTGNPGMATAGSGDVLTGIVGALLARGVAPRDACRVAVFAHGDAGDRAAERKGQEGMIAADLLDRLPDAFLAIGGQGDGKTW